MAGRYSLFRKDRCAQLAPRLTNEDLDTVAAGKRVSRDEVDRLVRRMKESRDGQEANKKS